MSKPDPSLLFLDPDSDARFVVKERPNFSDMPASDTLSRLRAFLPAMHQANEDLARQQKATPTSVLDEFIQIEENGESDEEVEEYEEEDVEKVQEEPQGEEKKMIQMELYVVPNESDDEEGKEVTLDGKPTMDVSEDDDDDEMVDAEGNPLPEIQRRILEASRVKKPKMEFVESQQDANNE